MERKDRIDATGAIILIVFMAVLGGNQVAIKVVNDGLGPLFQAAMRSVCAGVLIFGLCAWRGIKIDVSRAILIPGLATGFCFAFEFALLFKAIEYTTVARSTVFFYTMPFWVAIAAHFLIPGERLTPVRITGLVLAGLGVVIALSNENTQAGPNAFLGDLMALLGATGWAAIAIIARTTKFSTIKPELQLLYQLVVSAILLVPLSLYVGDTIRDLTSAHLVLFSMQVVFVVCIGFLTWFWVLSIYPASDMASFSFLGPLFGLIFGWLVLDEKITSTIVIALILVAIGIVLVNRKAKPSE